MNVHPVPNSVPSHPFVQVHIPPGQEKDSKPDVEGPANAGESDLAEGTPSADAASEADGEINDDGKDRGVIRMLEEGHFRGVADVRLRINFFDELAARAAGNGGMAASEQIGDLVNAVNSQVDSLVEGLTLSEEVQSSLDTLRSKFDSTVSSAVDTFTTSNARDTFTHELQSAFEAFVADLRALLEQILAEPVPAPLDETDTGEAGATGEADGDSTEQPEAPADDPFTDLLNAFDQSLSTLLGAVSSAVQLADPSPPNGNGVAYEKFLAIYNELRGLGDTIEEIV